MEKTMTSEEFLRRLKAAESVTNAAGADDDVIRDVTAHIKLPAAHENNHRTRPYRLPA
jgi:hypothetical protein